MKLVALALVLATLAGCADDGAVSSTRLQPTAQMTRAVPAGWCLNAPAPHVPTGKVQFLSKVSAPAANDVWVLGGYDTGQESGPRGEFAAHWDGSSWQLRMLRIPEGGVIEDIAAVNAHDVWVVGSGERNHPLIEHWDGFGWSDVVSRNAGGLNAITALSPDDVWAVGGAVGDHSLIEHWDGSSWHVMPNPAIGTLEAVSAASPSDIWAVGERGDSAPQTWSNTLTEHWDGSSWRVVPSPTVPGPSGKRFDWLFGVSATPTGAWAVGMRGTPPGIGGGGEHALVLHRTRGRWQLVSPPRSAPADILWSVTTAGGSPWVVGEKGVYGMLIAHFSHGRWVEPHLPASQGYPSEVTPIPGGVLVVGQTHSQRPLVMRCSVD